jgi:hypothetical protein
MKYFIEVDRSGICESNVYLHVSFNKEPTREEIEQIIINEDCGYDKKYCEFIFYEL